LYSLNNIDFVRINIKNEDPSNFLFGAFLFFGTCFLMLALAKHNAAIAFVNSKRPGSLEPVEGIINLKVTDFTKESTFYCVSTEQVQELEAKLKWYSNIVESKLYLKMDKTNNIVKNASIGGWPRFEADSKRCIENIKAILSENSINSGVILSEDQKNMLCSNITNLNGWLVRNQELFDNCEYMHTILQFFDPNSQEEVSIDEVYCFAEEIIQNYDGTEEIFKENPWLYDALEEGINLLAEDFK
jgi:hypothetical protein